MATVLPKVDVVTVGVGWMGGIVAAELTKAGYNVVGLERGKGRTQADYLHVHDELKFPNRGELTHSLKNDTYTYRNTVDGQARPMRDRRLVVIGDGNGGSGTHWGGQTHRYFPYDFEIRSKTIERYGEAKIPEGITIQDWGITYDDLEPYYDKAEKMMGIGGEVDPNYPERANPYPNPPMKKTVGMKIFESTCKEMGYKTFVIPSGNMTQSYTNPDGESLNACMYCNFCGSNGCEYGAKADPIVTVIPTAVKTGKYEIRNYSEVRRVLYTGNKATGVLYVDVNTGEEFEQPAELVVLSSYTFSNVRLLLLSGIGTPYDSTTGSGIIGKNFTDHHAITMSRLYFKEKKFNKFIGSGALGLVSTDFTGDLFDHSNLNFLHGAQIECRETGDKPISGNNYPRELGIRSWGRDFKRESIYYFHRNLAISCQKATLPHKNNYLDLDPTYKDENGDPLLRLTYDYTDNDRQLHEFFTQKAIEIGKQMGADYVDPMGMAPNYMGMLLFGHNAGGAIMGDSPENSAVNNYLQLWDMDNLFVLGASAMPHFSCSNPTLTISALAYRSTEGMIKYLQEGGQLVSSTQSKMFT